MMSSKMQATAVAARGTHHHVQPTSSLFPSIKKGTRRWPNKSSRAYFGEIDANGMAGVARPAPALELLCRDPAADNVHKGRWITPSKEDHPDTGARMQACSSYDELLGVPGWVWAVDQVRGGNTRLTVVLCGKDPANRKSASQNLSGDEFNNQFWKFPPPGTTSPTDTFDALKARLTDTGNQGGTVWLAILCPACEARVVLKAVRDDASPRCSSCQKKCT